MKIVAIIQARMGSTRLPGKVMKRILNKPLLEYQIERVRRSKLIDEIVIATTTKQSEQPIIEFCKYHKLSVYRGSEEDVLSRYYEAALKYQADTVVRLTSDCPIIDPEVIDNVINNYTQHKDKFDYVSNTLDRTFPRGMDTEVFSFNALERSFNEATTGIEKEHVTPYIYENKNLFIFKSVRHSVDLSHYRWTVDTQEDFLLINKILTNLYETNQNFTWHEVLELLKQNKNWLKINSDIKQIKI